MSFDFQIANRDLVISDTGDLAIVQDNAKLLQDVLKILLTPIGANRFNPSYGSALSKSLVGNNLPTTFSKSIAEGQINSAMNLLQKLQQDQAQKRQLLTGGEILAAIVGSPSINRNPVDPRFISVSLRIATKALTVIPVSFAIPLV